MIVLASRSDVIEVKQNLTITARCNGKLVARRRGHNIWLNVGREWISRLMGYSSFSPLTPEEDDRIRYMGFGIGGVTQNALGVANGAPLLAAYPGTNVQNDVTATVTALERPVRVSGINDAPPYADPSNVWLIQVQAPPEHPTATQTVFRCLLNSTAVSYAPFTVVPLSEVGLFTNAANPALYNNAPVAYDQYQTLSKTTAVDALEVVWTLRT